MFPRSSFLYKCVTAVFVVIVFMYSLMFQRADQRFRKRLAIHTEDQFRTEFIRSTVANVQVVRVRTTTKQEVVYTGPLVTERTTPKIVHANPHNFKFILNPVNMCVNNDVYLIIYIHTAPANFRRRQIIRHTWGDPSLLTKFKAKLVFVMGQVSDNKLMQKVQLEHEHYGDVIQEDFTDTYRNLTYKGICALKWISNYCNKATFALKVDDDILVNIYKISDHVHNYVTKHYGTKELILCNQWVRMKVLRDKKSKWYIPREDFALDYFPPYCSGSAFILSADVVRRMYVASFDVPFFWVDDYYITGALASKIKVHQRRLNEMYMLNGRVAPEKFKNDTQYRLAFFHVQKLNTIFRMWKSMKKGMEEKKASEEHRTIPSDE